MYIAEIYNKPMIHYFPGIIAFDWDDGNRDKNFLKHKVTNHECEQVFFNEPLIILDDKKHSQAENRYAVFGRTDEDKKLTIIFTLRGKLIRIISARMMNKREREFYGKEGQ